MGLINFQPNVWQLPSFNERATKQITKMEYDNFCKEFIFEQLRGTSFGKAFCDHFNLNDNLLPGLSDDGAKFMIEKLGYIK